MPWGDNGVTNFRTALDQAPVFTWGGAAVPVNFNPINNVGYLRRLWLRYPLSTQVVTLSAVGNNLAVPAEIQYPVHRGIGSFSVIAQGIAPLYQLSLGGVDLAVLSYMQNGRRPWQRPSPIAIEANAATNTQSIGHTSDQWVGRQGLVVSAGGGATQNLTYAGSFDIPLTEWVQFPAGVMAGPNGQMIPIPGQWAEVGLLTAQNTQQNLRTAVTQNPAWSVVGGTKNTLMTAITSIPTSTLSTTVQLFSEFYDVPSDPANQPPPFTQDWVITRQTRDWPIAANQVVPKFEPAGLLMRVAYVFLDANGGIVDISGQAVDGTITFKWGSSVYKFNAEPFEFNLMRTAEIYGEPPPAGMLFHDFFVDRVLTDLINTAELASVSAEIKGLPAAAVTCHVIEERMVPVRTG